MPEGNNLSPVAQTAIYVGGFAAYLAIHKINQKLEHRRRNVKRMRILGEWVSTAQDIRSLPEVMEED